MRLAVPHFILYNSILITGLILSLPFLPLLWICLGPRFRLGLAQRLGFYSREVRSRSAGTRPVWIHAASVGEVRSVVPLIRNLKARFPAPRILLSTFTLTGNRLGHEIGADFVIFLPLDFCWSVRRAFATFTPAAIVVVETEIWPNLLREAYRRGIPTVLLSGRLSARSLSSYLRFKFFFAKALSFFSALGMQTEQDAQHILSLGAPAEKVSVVGSLKFADGRAPGQDCSLSSLLPQGRRWLVAGSTHRGEESVLLEVMASLRGQYPKLSMILAPRHPERFDEVERLLQSSGFEYARRSQIDAAEPFDKDILLLDSVGELADFFALGDIAFVGGSLVDVGGHNVLEPARWRKPVLFGPFMANFKAIAEELKRAGAAIEVSDREELSESLRTLLGNPDQYKQMGERAAQVANGDNHAVARNFELAQRFL